MATPGCVGATLDKKMKSTRIPKPIKWGCFTPTIGIVALVIILLLADRFVPSSARRALPASATEIQEYYDDSWNGDFARVIKAKLPEKDYTEYARRLGLTVRFDPLKHAEIASSINMGVGGPEWWNPPQATETIFCLQEGRRLFAGSQLQPWNCILWGGIVVKTERKRRGAR